MLQESTLLISDTQEHAEAKIHFSILITWPVLMNGSLNCISTDLENALEVYDEMKHMFSDDFWKVGKHKTREQCYTPSELPRYWRRIWQISTAVPVKFMGFGSCMQMLRSEFHI